jgi:hypothetical protein
MVMAIDEELKDRFTEAFGAAPPLGKEFRAADQDALVELTWSASGELAVHVTRALVPVAADRDQLERALQSAITSLVTQREAASAAAGAALGESITQAVGADMEQYVAEMDARVKAFKSQVEARQQAIRDRRSRLGR